jgi:membrane associated rhomboid family serine protease
MIPLRDENPTVHRPIATIAIIALNAAVWGLLQGFGTEPALAKSICLHGLVPGDLLGTAAAGAQFPLSDKLVCVLDGSSSWTSVVSSMFMHGSWLHIIGNMWFLWIFGDNVEDVMGPVRFAIFYLLCGFAAAAAQIFVSPASIVPMVGASGAIGGVMGAYALLYPRARIDMFVFLGFYMTTIAVPAVLMLGYWFLLQLLSGLPGLGGDMGGVAFWAHVGGCRGDKRPDIAGSRRDFTAADRSGRSAPPHRVPRHCLRRTKSDSGPSRAWCCPGRCCRATRRCLSSNPCTDSG